MSDYSIPNWKPGIDFGVLLSDETAEDRSPESLSQMIREITGVVNKYGFDFSAVGTLESLRKYFKLS